MESYTIINDNEEYRKRNYFHIGYSVAIFGNRFRDYFPKLRLDDKELENRILEIELTQRDVINLFFRLSTSQFSSLSKNAMGFEIPTTKGPGNWRTYDNKKRFDFILETTSGLINRDFTKEFRLFSAEVKGQSIPVYDTTLPDTILAVKPEKARLVLEVPKFRFADKLLFMYRCVQHVVETEIIKLYPDLDLINEYIISILPQAQEYSLENSEDASGFRFFIEANYTELYKKYVEIKEKTIGFENDLIWEVRSLATLFLEMFNFSHTEWNSLLCCRIAASTQLLKSIRNEGFQLPSLNELSNNDKKYFQHNRIWFARQKKELEYQSNLFSDFFAINLK